MVCLKPGRLGGILQAAEAHGPLRRRRDPGLLRRHARDQPRPHGQRRPLRPPGFHRARRPGRRRALLRARPLPCRGRSRVHRSARRPNWRFTGAPGVGPEPDPALLDALTTRREWFADLTAHWIAPESARSVTPERPIWARRVRFAPRCDAHSWNGRSATSTDG